MAQPIYLHTNNATAGLRDAINATTTIVRVAAGLGTLFPNPQIGEAFFLTVEDRRAGKLEIMLCTSRSSDSMTVTRGQQGTVAQSFVAGVNVSNRVTATILNEFSVGVRAVIPIEQIPMIPDSKLVSMTATKLTGTINSGRLPVIPPDLLTSVPAQSLTGTISNERLPVIWISNLPLIPDSHLTGLTATKLTGTIALARLPIIPDAQISSLNADKLIGKLPNSVLAGNDYSFDFLDLTGALTADETRVAMGSAIDPSYTFASVQDSGFYWSPGNGLGMSVNGAVRALVTASRVQAVAGVAFYGSGAGLTDIPNTAVSSTLAREQIALGTTGQLGTYALMRTIANSGEIQPNQVVSGSTLQWSSASDITGSTGPSGTTKWRCMGYIPSGGGSAGDRTTLFLRTE